MTFYVWSVTKKWASLLWVTGWCWDVWCLIGWGSLRRRGVLRICTGSSERGSWTFPAQSWTLSQMTQSGICVMNADSCLAEIIGCFNNILELSIIFSIFVNIKYMLCYSECSHLKEKVANWTIKLFWWFYSLA